MNSTVGQSRRRRLWAGAFAMLATVVLALAAGAGAAPAQQAGSIEGKVTAQKSSEPLSGVTILVEGVNRTALTDHRGTYRITGVPTGQQVVLARRLGHEPQRQTVSVTAGAVAPADFSLAEAALQLSDIVVSATREQERRVEIPVTIGVVDGGALRATRPAHPSEIMNKVAGVWVNVTGGEGHMAAIRQPMTTDPVYLYLEDGVPSRSTGFFNHNALYEINLPQADRIEVSKGPANALYGSDAIGGVINVSTRAPSVSPQLAFSAEGGAYKWGRLLASASNTWGGTGLRADLNLTRTDGWRQATDYDRQSGTVRWDQSVGGASRIKTVATFSRIEQQTAGTSAVSLADYLNNPTSNYTPISVRQVKAFRFSAAFERQGSTSLLSFTPYARYDWMRLLPNWSLTYDPQDYTTQNRSIGFLAKYRRDFEPLRTRVIVGVDADVSPGGQVENSVAAVRTGNVFTSYTLGARVYDYDVTFQGVSPYLHSEVSPTRRLRITAGLRYDFVGYDYTNHLSVTQTGRWRRPGDTRVTYDHLSPKVGATYEFGSGFNVFASYRHGFRTPAQGQLFRQGSAVNTVGLQPIKVNSYEAGARGQLGSRVDYDLAAYSMTKTDDILSFTTPTGATETLNAGRTSHRGIEVSLGVLLVPAVRIDLAYSHAQHKYDDWRPRATVDLSGNEIQSAPRQIGNASLSYAPAVLNGGQFAVEWSRIASYWMDQENTHEYAGYNRINLRGSVPVGRGMSVSARLMNLTNERFAELASYTAARGEEYAPGMPRTVYAGLQYNLR